MVSNPQTLHGGGVTFDGESFGTILNAIGDTHTEIQVIFKNFLDQYFEKFDFSESKNSSSSILTW